MVTAAAALALSPVLAAPGLPASEALPPRVRRIVVHALGGPSYGNPARRFVFFPPAETHALWKPHFGAHWIVWTDGTLWPRHAEPGRPRSWMPPAGRDAGPDERRRLTLEATPVYGHVRGGNSRSVGIELAHSGRSSDPWPEDQVRSLAWLLRALLAMSGGRLGPHDVCGHKDLEPEPAWVHARCARRGCPVFVDAAGRPFRRRVDPPESVFASLRRHGLDVPRQPDGDAELRRAEALRPDARPATATLEGPP